MYIHNVFINQYNQIDINKSLNMDITCEMSKLHIVASILLILLFDYTKIIHFKRSVGNQNW